MHTFDRNWLSAFFGFTLFSSSLIVMATPIVEQMEGVELDWSNLTLRFTTSYTPHSKEELLSSNEKIQIAFDDALKSARGVFSKIHKEIFLKQGLSPDLVEQSNFLAVEEATKTTRIYKISYYKDGGIKLFLESYLPKILARDDLSHKQYKEDSKNPSRFSGIILRLDKNVQASARYEIVDSTGVVLFEDKSLTRTAYKDHLMGHWLLDPQREELVTFVGKKPISVQLKVLAPNRFLIQKKVWMDAIQDNFPVLSEGKIAIALPK